MEVWETEYSQRDQQHSPNWESGVQSTVIKLKGNFAFKD